MSNMGMARGVTMHKPTKGSLSWGLGLHSINELPNIDASLINLHDSIASRTTYPSRVLIPTYQATL